MFIRKNELNEIIDSSLSLNTSLMIVSVPLFVIGIATIIISIGSQNMFIVLSGLIILFVDVLLLFCKEQIALDQDKKKIFLIKNTFIFRLGEKHELKNFESVIMNFDISSSNSRLPVFGPSVSWYGSSSRHYEIFMVGKNKKIFLKELNELKEAIEFQKKISEKTGLTFITNDIFIKGKIKNRRR